MFRRTLVTAVLIAAAALGLAASAGAAVPGGQQNWLNMDAGLHVRATWLSNQPFRLKSNYTQKLLGYGNQTYGVDLQWGDHGDWVIGLSGHGGTRAVTQSDRVSLYNTMARKYLVYGNETFGVDLQWSDTPSFEWQIAGTGVNRGLYNDAIHDYLQWGVRTWGVNLIWNFHEIGDDESVEPPDYAPAPTGPQVSYVTLSQALYPGAAHELMSGHLAFQTYHTAIVDQIQNTSQYPITMAGQGFGSGCHGLVLGVGQILQGQALTTLNPDQRVAAPTYDVRSCGPVGATGNGTSPLVRVTYHYAS